MNRIHPFRVKAKQIQNLKSEIPFHGIEGFHHIQFQGHEGTITFLLLHGMEDFMSYHGIVMDGSALEKG